MTEVSLDFGEEINSSILNLPRAIAVTDLLRNGESSYAELAQVLRDASGVETVVLDLEVELPQIPRYPLKDRERVAVRFFPGDQRAPDVRALREDFPRLPHQNLVSEEYPKSLCLYDRPEWHGFKGPYRQKRGEKPGEMSELMRD